MSKYVEIKEDIEDCQLKKGDICEVLKSTFMVDSATAFLRDPENSQYATFVTIFNERIDNYVRVSVNNVRPYHGEKKA